MERSLSEPFVTAKTGETPAQVLGEEVVVLEDRAEQLEEEVFMDFGELEDYTELYGEMGDF